MGSIVGLCGEQKIRKAAVRLLFLFSHLLGEKFTQNLFRGAQEGEQRGLQRCKLFLCAKPVVKTLKRKSSLNTKRHQRTL